MKTLEEFRLFYDSDLTPVLKELEVKRKKGLKLAYLLILTVVSGIVASLISLISAPEVKTILIIIIALTALVLIVLFSLKLSRIRKTIKKEYKQRIIRSMISFIDPHLNYKPEGRISESTFNGSKIFLKDPDRYNGDDLVEGMIGKTDVEFSELHAEYYTTNDKGNKQYHTIFRGIFFIADFHKNFIGETIVLPDTAEKLFGKLGTMFQKMNVVRPKLVKLENPEFEKAFAVYGTDQIEARYILTPSMMERIMDFKNKSGKIHLSFLHSKVYIAIQVNKNLFEPPFLKSMLDFRVIEEYFSYLRLSVNIVEDLDLNTRIWSKE